MKHPTSKPRKGAATTAGVLTQVLPLALLALAFVGVGVFHVTARVMVVDAGYRLSRLEGEQRRLLRENDTLKLELAMLKSPGRLEAVAREDLGMAPPSPGQVITPRGAPRQARAAPSELLANQKRPARAANP